MGFSVIPTSVGGVSINSVFGPLGSLYSNSGQVDNMTFPSDLGSNPAMCHAVVFEIFDRKTVLADDFSKIANPVYEAVTKAAGPEGNTINAIKAGIESLANSVPQLGQVGLDALKASSYNPTPQKTTLATVSMFMPETLSVNYNSQYSEISMTQELGLPGMLATTYTDRNNPNSLKNSITGIASRIINEYGQKVGFGQDIGSMLAQAGNVTVNPQMQLLYRGINLREFQLEFILTPKSAAEAQVAKNICDTFTFYSLPGTSGATDGTAGQYITPPQLFNIKFKFLGQNGVLGNISNIFKTALTNVGLGFLSSTQNITNGNDAKFFTINDCVLESVNIDYAPNGFATYNDGHPVQTRLTLQFKETQMITKQQFKGTAIYDNYNKARFENTIRELSGNK
jgi:hypothetical protein